MKKVYNLGACLLNSRDKMVEKHRYLSIHFNKGLFDFSLIKIHDKR